MKPNRQIRNEFSPSIARRLTSRRAFQTILLTRAIWFINIAQTTHCERLIMTLYQRIRAVVTLRRRGPVIVPTPSELEMLRDIRICARHRLTFVLRPETALEILDRLGAENAKDRRAAEGWDRWTTIEQTGYDPE